MKRKLGKSDIEITPIGLGVWQFSEAQGFHKYIWKAVDSKTRQDIVDVTIKGGINWFDTAEIYGNGRSERGLRTALKDLGAKDPDILIATKWKPLLRTSKSIGKTFHKREENLSPYPITLHQVHMPYSFSKPEAEMKEMAKLLDAGKIRSTGVSNFSASQMRRAFEELEKHGYPMVSNQVKYSIFDRRIENNGILDAAKELGITIIAYSPLEQGLLTGRFHENPDAVKSLPMGRKMTMKRIIEKSRPLVEELLSIAEKYEVKAGQVALRWLIDFHGDTVVAIPGASKVYQAEQNAQVLSLSLSKEELNTLDSISRELW
ncbi:MAG: aldo/keto reductase [Candidatus Heimdallarchaeota archaeon]|nr:aldo/keto reductase [Candidatus Heimdallarchaeota archaeon]